MKGDKIESFEHLEICQLASQELAQSWEVERKGKGSKTKSLEPNLSPYTFDLLPIE